MIITQSTVEAIRNVISSGHFDRETPKFSQFILSETRIFLQSSKSSGDITLKTTNANFMKAQEEKPVDQWSQ